MPDPSIALPRDRVSPLALAYYLAVVNAGGVTAAAQRLRVSQPTVSAQIKYLKQRFPGVDLLERTDKGVVPTEAGQALVDYATRVLQMLDELEHAMDNRSDGAQGSMALGASLTSGERLLPQYIARFVAAHPLVRIEMSVGNATKMMRLVDERSVDLAVVGRRPIGPDYFVAPIFAERIIAFVSTRPGGSLRELPVDSVIPAPALNRELFVMRERTSGNHAQAMDCLHDAGCTPSRVIELESNEAVRELVRSGVGIGLLSSSAVEPELRASANDPDGATAGLRPLAITPWNNARTQWLVALRSRPRSQTVQDFLALLPVADVVKTGPIWPPSEL